MLLLSCSGPAIKPPVNKLAEKKLKERVKTKMEFWFFAQEIEGVSTTKSLDSKTLEKYEERGNLIGEIVYDNRITKKVIDSFVHINDAFGKPLKTMRYNGNGSLYAYYVYTYNKAGTLKEDTRYFDNGKKHTQNSYKYDGQNLMEHRRFVFKEYNNSVVETLTRYVYNSKGQKIESRTYDEEHITYYSTFYKYDSRGNQIEEYAIVKDGTEQKTQTAYDKDGNETEHHSMYRGKVYHSTSSYIDLDEQGNWQNRLMYSDGILNQIVHREFTYY